MSREIQNPIVDLHNNPFYCPAIPSNNFIASLRRKRQNLKSRIHSFRNQRFILKSFYAALDRCLFKGGGDSDDDGEPSNFKEDSEAEPCNEVDFDTLSTIEDSLYAHIYTKDGQTSFRDSPSGTQSALLHTRPQNNASLSTCSAGFVTLPFASATADGYPTRSSLAAIDERSDVPVAPNRYFRSQPLGVWNGISLDTSNHMETRVSFKRKYDESDPDSTSTESDWGGSPKRVRSNLSISDGSFYVTVRREKLQFTATSSTVTTGLSPVEPKINYDQTKQGPVRIDDRLERIRKDWMLPMEKLKSLDHRTLASLVKSMQAELFGPFFGLERSADILDAVKEINQVLPGVRIKDRLLERLKCQMSCQTVLDFLEENGYLNTRILELFRASKITRLSLSESLRDVYGLNLIEDHLFPVFSKPNSFLCLTDLILDGIPLTATMLLHIQHLPKLSKLSLFDSAVDDECIYLLVPLRRTLSDLNVSRNPSITGDAVPALIVMDNLSHLSIAETSIEVPGARLLAKGYNSRCQRITIDFPEQCCEYVENMKNKYLLDLPPPLITNPNLCDRLSVAALQRNLAAHAEVNRSISARGTKDEMGERLRKLLEMRLGDLEICRIMEQVDEVVL